MNIKKINYNAALNQGRAAGTSNLWPGTTEPEGKSCTWCAGGKASSISCVQEGKTEEGFCCLVAIEPPSAHRGPAARPAGPPLAFMIARSFKKRNKLHLCNLVKSDLLHSPSASKTLHAPATSVLKHFLKGLTHAPPPGHPRLHLLVFAPPARSYIGPLS